MMIYDRIRTQAEINPGRIAVSLSNFHYTYERLETESNRLAGQLLISGFKKGDRAGLFMDKTPEAIIAMLGIAKAGGIYIPLDIHSPRERLVRILDSSQTNLLLVDRAARNRFGELTRENEMFSELPWAWWSRSVMDPGSFELPPQFTYSDTDLQPDLPYQISRDPGLTAHILYTSGSTGIPKGVAITHKNLTSFIDWAIPYFDIRACDRTSGHAPLHFDLSMFDIYGSLGAGAHLYLVPQEMSVIPGRLASFILENDLTQWFSVPSVLSYMARFAAIPPAGFPGLKRLIWCGEVFPVPALRYWMENLPDVTFTNLYGPTEATIASSYYTVPEVPEPDQVIPIGKACGGEKLLVLDEERKPVDAGEKGDLYIAGDGLSPGFWRDPEKTENAFFMFENPDGSRERIYKTGDLASLGSDGNVYYHGRSDYQIKSRGYRIELGEIESALSETSELLEYAVVPVSIGGFEGTAIGCAYVCRPTENGNMPALLRSVLREKVPGYMIPHFWKPFTKLPRNVNGKIDRKYLSAAFRQTKTA